MNAMSKHARLTAVRGLVRENPVLPVIALIGFSVSFQTITALARAQHMPGSPYLYPVLIDVFFLGLVVEARKAIDDGRSDLVPRAMAWVLAGFTVYVNAHGSPARDWLGITLHVTAPVAWITFLELTRWRKLRKKRAERPTPSRPPGGWWTSAAPPACASGWWSTTSRPTPRRQPVRKPACSAWTSPPRCSGSAGSGMPRPCCATT